MTDKWTCADLVLAGGGDGRGVREDPEGADQGREEGEEGLRIGDSQDTGAKITIPS